MNLLLQKAAPLAAIGHERLSMVCDAANCARANTVPDLYLLNELRKNYLRLLIWMNRHIRSTEDFRMSEIEGVIKCSRRGVVDAIKKYEKDGCWGRSCISDDKDKDYLNQIATFWEKFDAQLDPILVASWLNHKDKACEAMLKTLDVSGKIVDLINEQFDHKMELGKKAWDEGDPSNGPDTMDTMKSELPAQADTLGINQSVDDIILSVSETVAAMNSLAGPIGSIDDIVAYQTKLLDLNAVVEAGLKKNAAVSQARISKMKP